jgi:hypothetical protein
MKDFLYPLPGCPWCIQTWDGEWHRTAQCTRLIHFTRNHYVENTISSKGGPDVA